MSGEDVDRNDPIPYAETSAFTRLLAVPSRVKIIDVFLGKHFTELTAGEIAHLAGVDVTTVHRNIENIIDYGLVVESGKDGKAQQYRLNKSSRIAKILGRARDELMKESDKIPRPDTSQFVATARRPPNIQESLENWSLERDRSSRDSGPRPSEFMDIGDGEPDTSLRAEG